MCIFTSPHAVLTAPYVNYTTFLRIFQALFAIFDLGGGNLQFNLPVQLSRRSGAFAGWRKCQRRRRSCVLDKETRQRIASLANFSISDVVNISSSLLQR